MTTLPPSCAECLEIWGFKVLEPSGPVQACNGIALPLRTMVVSKKTKTCATYWGLLSDPRATQFVPASPLRQSLALGFPSFLTLYSIPFLIFLFPLTNLFQWQWFMFWCASRRCLVLLLGCPSDSFRAFRQPLQAFAWTVLRVSFIRSRPLPSIWLFTASPTLC